MAEEQTLMYTLFRGEDGEDDLLFKITSQVQNGTKSGESGV